MAKIKMYTTPWCGYCTAAKRLLNQKGVEYEDIDVRGDRKTRAWLVEVTGRTSVPQIFIDDVAMGGFDDINALDRRGELDSLLGI